MKFVYTAGQYTQFMGRMFAFGQPQDITDRATLEAIRKRPDFKEWKDEEKVPAKAEKVMPEQPKPQTLSIRRRIL